MADQFNDMPRTLQQGEILCRIEPQGKRGDIHVSYGSGPKFGEAMSLQISKLEGNVLHGSTTISFGEDTRRRVFAVRTCPAHEYKTLHKSWEITVKSTKNCSTKIHKYVYAFRHTPTFQHDDPPCARSQGRRAHCRAASRQRRTPQLPYYKRQQ